MCIGLRLNIIKLVGLNELPLLYHNKYILVNDSFKRNYNYINYSITRMYINKII